MAEFIPAVIRDMTSDDIFTVANIARSSMPYAWSEHVFYDCLKANYNAWIMESDGNLLGTEVIGFGILLMQLEDCELMNICVQAQYQGKGYGKQMLQHMIAFAKSKNAGQIMLEVRKSNHAAISIYRAHGFIDVGERKYYYPAGAGREDAVILVLGLG